ncbi:cytochrome c [Alphaproteobacteria bacterium]|nr:cytochrome c [Alphaproteobacteria bacterium]
MSSRSIIIIFSLISLSVFSYKASAKSNIDVFKGMELYTSNCASCHMGNLSGNQNWKSGVDDDGQRLPPPLNGTAHTWHHSPEQLFQIIRYGYKKFDPNYKGKMLGNDNLSEDDVWSILEYIKSVWPKEIRDKYNNHFK